ncbi:MAG: extracellular solute-binding protein [Rectinemataceae bacterium]|jgi:multiple sugar transport system substrate-binding protein/sn-glycerol 3-phosphate transport system substrate-binding protein
MSGRAWKSLVFALLASMAALGALGAQDFEKLKLRGTVVTYWYQHNQGREESLKKMIDRFNATNRWGISVKGEYAGGYNDIANKMTAGIAGGSTPDLVVAYQNNAATYELSEALVDLSPYVADANFGIAKTELADYFPGFLAQDINQQFGGKRLGWPPNRSIEVLYYNADWLKKLGIAAPPKTWDEFYAAVKLATDPAKGRYGCDISLDASNVFAQVISRGGDFQARGGKGYALNTPQIRASFAFFLKIYKEGYAKKIAEQYGDQTDFANNKVLFTMGSTSGIPFYDLAVRKGASGGFAWNVAPIPHSTAKAVLDIYGASVSVVKSTPQKQLAAWLFLRWMSESAQQAEWVRASNYFPVRKSTAGRLGDYLSQNPQFAAAWKGLQTSDQKAEPSFLGYEQVRDAISAAYNAVLDGAELDSTLAALDAKANRIFLQAKP